MLFFVTIKMIKARKLLSLHRKKRNMTYRAEINRVLPRSRSACLLAGEGCGDKRASLSASRSFSSDNTFY